MSCLNSPSAYPESSQRGSPSQSTNYLGVEEIGEEHEKEVFISEAPVGIAVPDTLTGLEKTSFTECSEILYAVAKYKPYRNGHFEVVPAWTKVLNVTGALCRKTDPKIATAPKTQSRSKDQNKDKDNSK